ncbi:phf5-like protein [Malassezia pachydermatis]|uniref:Phf5-like protein n=1 Tax=Malassezia pachydermatis TaxID=77020 RepID=A0A0M8MTW5_9BASI|nr:phf5-like protein [Malassezia pachydermatis]KOS13511.1 phf5-like protein [Malassezia pachydermatis]
MSKHHPDLILCRKLPGIAIGRLCERCDGKCPICDSYVRPAAICVVAKVYRMHIIAQNAPDLKKIGMVVRRR